MQNYKAKIIALKRNLAVHVYGAGVLWYCDPVVCTVVTCTSTCTVTSNSCCDQFIYKLEKQDYMMFDFFFPPNILVAPLVKCELVGGRRCIYSGVLLLLF